MSYDSILKFLLDEYPTPILSWLLNTPVTESIEILKTELNVEPIRADSVFFVQVGNKIVHLEFQTTPQSKPSLPLRMLDYWVRLYRLYEKDIEQIVIFLTPTTSQVVFQDVFQKRNTNHRYRIVRLWECEPKPLLEIPELLPLAVLAKANRPKTLLAQVARRIDRIEDKYKQGNIAACVELLAGIKFSEALISAYLREDIMQESVIYQKIIRKGVEQGIQQGIQQGVQQGIQQGVQQGVRLEAISLISRQLRRRFGELGDNLQAQLQHLSVEQLDSLGEGIFDFQSLDDVVSWLNQVKA